MRIVHIDPERTFSGGEVQVFLLMEGLRRRGHQSVLVCTPGSGPEREARARGFETHAVSIRNNVDLMAVMRLRGAIREEDADLVHLHTGRASWIGGWAARLASCPALCTRRMDRPIKPNWRTRWIYSNLVRHTAAISPAVMDHLHQGGVPVERTRLIWSSIDPSALESTRSRESLRKELGAGPKDVLLLGAGTLTHRKGFDVLLESLACMHRGGTRLVIAGEGEERRALALLTRRLGLDDRVQFLGRRTDIPDLLAACDLFVMPSRAEGLGIAALEAMAAGRPVVASDVGGLREVAVDGHTGLLVPPGDVAALAKGLQELVSDRSKRLAYGAAGPPRVKDRFRVEQMVDSYENLYHEVLAEGSGV